MSDDADYVWRLYDAMERFLAAKGVADADVYGFQQETVDIGYCGTCTELVTSVWIFYRDDDSVERRYGFIGDFGELIRALTDEGHVAA